MMQQLKKMQQEMARVQDELANTSVEGTAAGGVVTCAVNGEFRVTKLTIKPEAVDPEDIDTLEDLVVVGEFQLRHVYGATLAEDRDGHVHARRPGDDTKPLNRIRPSDQ